MNVGTIVSDVKARAEVVAAKGQELVETGFETLKAANAIVVEGVQSLLQTNMSAGKELLSAAQQSLHKAKADGIKAVANNPTAYVPPESKDCVVAAYNESRAVVTKTSDELVKTLKQGYETLSAKLAAEQAAAAAEAEASAEASNASTHASGKKGGNRKKKAATAA